LGLFSGFFLLILKEKGRNFYSSKTNKTQKATHPPTHPTTQGRRGTTNKLNFPEMSTEVAWSFSSECFCNRNIREEHEGSFLKAFGRL
jgi:hypothetical protein